MTNDDRGSVPPVSPERPSTGGVPPNPPPEAGARPSSRGVLDGGLFEASTANAQLIYVLYLLGFVLGGLSTLVGVVFAYVYKDAAPGWLKSHYHYQIRTFWLAVLYSIVATVLALVFIGFLLMILVAVWLILRCVKGLTRLQKSEPIDDVRTWWV